MKVKDGLFQRRLPYYHKFYKFNTNLLYTPIIVQVSSLYINSIKLVYKGLRVSHELGNTNTTINEIPDILSKS